MYGLFNVMPKGAIHHLQTVNAPSVQFFISLTKKDGVYFNDGASKFKVAIVRAVSLYLASRKEPAMKGT